MCILTDVTNDYLIDMISNYTRWVYFDDSFSWFHNFCSTFCIFDPCMGYKWVNLSIYVIINEFLKKKNLFEQKEKK